MSRVAEEKSMVPELRFSEYQETWNLAKLGTRVEKVGSGVTPRGGAEAYVPEGIPLIRSQNVNYDRLDLSDVVFIPKEIHEGMSGSKVHADDVLLNITGASIGRSCVVPIEVEEANVNQHVCIIRLNNDNPSFLQTFLSSWRGQKLIFQSQAGGGREGLNFESIRSFKIAFPGETEQQKIANFLTAVDAKLNLLRRKRDSLQTYKRGVMQKIFSQEIRFKQDDGSAFPDWEERKLGQLTTKTGKKNKLSIQYPIYSINNKEGFLPQTDQFEGVSSNDRGYDISMYKIIEKHTFAYNPARINVGSIGYSDELENIIISSLYVCFKTTSELSNKYLSKYLDTYEFNKAVRRNVEGGVREYLFYENFSNIKILLPSVEEQERIAEFLDSLDVRLKMAKRKISKMENFKKGLLQKMFV